MELNLLEQLMLLSLDDDKGDFLQEQSFLNYALPGAVLLELALHHKIEIKDKKVKVLDKWIKHPLWQEYLDKLAKSKKERSLKTWITTMTWNAGKIQQEVIKELIEKGILRKDEKKYLWGLIGINIYPAQNNRPENELKWRLKEIIKHGEHPNEKEIMLLSLIHACDLTRAVFGKENEKEFKPKIKALVESEEIAKSLDKVVKAVQDEMTALFVIMMTTTVFTTTINT